MKLKHLLYTGIIIGIMVFAASAIVTASVWFINKAQAPQSLRDKFLRTNH